jgi:signal transduction histidine kinase
LVSPLYSQNIISKEKAVANYLYNFVKYTYWPKTSDKTFHIHLISQNLELEKELRSLYNQNSKNSKKVMITKSKTIRDGAEVIFVDSQLLQIVEELYAKVEGKPVLIITDGYQNLKLIMINLIPTNDNRIKFQINKANIINQGLRTDPKLTLLGGSEVDVAKLYKETKDTLQEQKKTLQEQKKALDKINKEIIQLNTAYEKREKELHKTKKNLDEQNKKLTDTKEKLFKLKKSLQETLKEKEEEISKIEEDQAALQKEMNKKENILAILSKNIEKEQRKLETLNKDILQKEGTIKEQQRYILILSLFTLIFILLTGIIIYLLKRSKQTNSELKYTQEELYKLNNTLEKKVKSEVEKNRQQEFLLLQQSRLVQMGEMISMIAHQWRQPLNILGMLNQTVILKYKENRLDDETIDYFKNNSKLQITQMTHTIDDFRNFFKPEKEKEEFYINEVIHKTIDMVKPIFMNEGININLNINVEPKMIGYPNELGQAILNIINNAKDALIEKNIQQKTISVSLFQNNDHPVLTISDNAGGISKEIIDKIFDPYFSTKEKNGTGLGLYMTKIIMEEHMNAKLDVTNNTEGAVFTVTF